MNKTYALNTATDVSVLEQIFEYNLNYLKKVDLVSFLSKLIFFSGFAKIILVCKNYSTVISLYAVVFVKEH